MSDFFKNNLIYLRELGGKNQIETAAILGLSRSTYANYETGANQPKADILMKILGHFNVSFEDLLNTDLTKGAKRQKKADKKTEEKGANLGANRGAKLSEKLANLEQNALNDGYATYQVTPKNNVFDFESKAAAGEALELFENDRLRMEPNLYLPHLGPGIHIRVPISGDSMHSTIKDSDKAVCTMVTDISDIRQGFIYVILDKQEGLVCKRVYLENKTTLELVSDNEIYKPYKRHLKEILSMFRVREIHSTDLRPYHDDIRKEMREIRSEMADMRRLIGGN